MDGSTSNQLLTLSTVTHYHHIIKNLRIFLEGYIDCLAC